jgi:sugar phosphate permease
MVLVYMFVPMVNTALLFVGLPFFAVLLMKFPPMGPFMTELYPTSVRGNAQGFCYNAGRAIGALFPTLVGVLSETMPLGPAIAVFSAIAFGLMIVMLLLLPETRGRRLDELEATADGPTPMLTAPVREEVAS